ncbi:lipopolysaccharide biosynthesis protein [Propionicicella superfundia]|uniref:lipopolysaccharide biosynthesis protein n=1 Tax=Propionicicella superfundia TaxID=348582 RepID=UPI000425FC5B|nr:hypothetical protein [Propionicicella superfundia]
MTIAPEKRPHDSLIRHIVGDSVFLFIASGSTALVGVAFWVVAARLMPAEALGNDSAVVSAITAAAAIAATGVGNAFVVCIPGSGVGRARLIQFGLRIVLCASLVTGLIVGVLVMLLVPGNESPLTVLLVTAATMVWALFVVQDPVLTATGRARWLVWENLPVNIAKLALLLVLAPLVPHPASVSMVLPAIVAVVVVLGLIRTRVAPPTAAECAGIADPPAEGRAWLRESRRRVVLFVLRDGTGSALGLGVFMGLPFVVTAVAGGSQGAVFMLCLQVSLGFDLITSAITVSLTTNGAAHPERVGDLARRVWLRLLLIAGVFLAGLLVLGRWALGVFGPEYQTTAAYLTLIVLAVGSALRTAFEVWTALMRIHHRTTELLIVNILGATVTVSLALVGAGMAGAPGAACGVLAGTLVTSVPGAIGLVRTGPGVAR